MAEDKNKFVFIPFFVLPGLLRIAAAKAHVAIISSQSTEDQKREARALLDEIDPNDTLFDNFGEHRKG